MAPVRATNGNEDVLLTVGVSQTKRAWAAIRTKEEVDGLMDVTEIKVTDSNRDLLKWYQEAGSVLELAAKKMPLLGSGSTVSKKSKNKK